MQDVLVDHVGRQPGKQAGSRWFDPVWSHHISVSIDMNRHVPWLMDVAAPRLLFWRRTERDIDDQ